MILIVLVFGITFNIFKDNMPKKMKSYSGLITNSSNSYTLQNQDGDKDIGRKIEILPNLNTSTGISITYDKLSASLSIRDKATEDLPKPDLEQSEVFDFQLQTSFKNHFIEIYYQNYQGLYVEYDGTAMDTSNTISTTNYGISIKKFTKVDFSLDESYMHFSNKRQTAWSWVQGFQLSKGRIFSKGSLIPTAAQGEFSTIKDLNAITITNTGLDFGITGQYAFELGTYISANLNLGVQLHQLEVDGVSQETRTGTSSQVSYMAEVGYAWGDKISGITFTGQSVEGMIEEVKFSNSRILFTLFYTQFF